MADSKPSVARSISAIGLALVSGADTKIQDGSLLKEQPHHETKENIEIPLWQLKEFSREPTYHEQMTKKEAEKKLREQGGSRCYLTRYSNANKANKISVMHDRGKNKFEHFEISRTKYALKDSDLEFKTVSEMLEYYQKHKISDTLKSIGIPVKYREETVSKEHNQPTSNNGSVKREELYVTLAQPAYLARRRTVMTGITQYPCYLGLMSGQEARQRLEQQPGNSYLVRFSDSQKKYIISVLKKGEGNAVVFQNFIINTEAKIDQHEYEIEGSLKRFDNFSDLLNYYEKYPISAEINCIGTPLSISNPPHSPNLQGLHDLKITPIDSSPDSPQSHTPDKTGTPSLVNFIAFPMADSKVNLAEKIGVNYKIFGVLLLDDNDGGRISIIEKEQRWNSYDINHEIFRMWLMGSGRQPVTWDTLVAVLHDIGLEKLANDIDSVIHNSSSDIDK